MLKLIHIIIFIILSFSTFGQLSKKDSIWLPMKQFIGEWKGTGHGPDGEGVYNRSYTLTLNSNFIEIKNSTDYNPTTEKPKGYLHEDKGIISYDKARKTFVLRQFHSEGFVNEYLIESISPDLKKISFITESIENIPSGYRARETYTFNPEGFTELFELAEPGKDFAKYTEASFRKK